MKRRQFITLLGGAATWPLAARAQQPAMPVIGYLHGHWTRGDAFRLPSISETGRAGLCRGRNFAVEISWAEGQANQRTLEPISFSLPDHVAELLKPLSLRAEQKTLTLTCRILPDVPSQIVGDPVELGLVSSLNRPGGNLTGVTSLNVEVGPSRWSCCMN